MNVDYSKTFSKQFEKLPLKKQELAKTAVGLLLQDFNIASLRKHALKGQWLGYYSISASGDLRLHFKIINENTVLFVAIGIHSQLYK